MCLNLSSLWLSDGLQDFARRRLLFKRLGQRNVLLLLFFEQPDVFDRDHSLISEGFQEGDCIFTEGPGRPPRDGDDPDNLLVVDHRHHQHAAEAPQPPCTESGSGQGVGLDQAKRPSP
jgi:hypothetical protein